MTIDRDRAQLYAAELAAFDGTDLEEVIGVDGVIARIDAVVEGDWWPGGGVVVRATRVDARSSATHCLADDVSAATIAIAPPQATVATAAHELAHALAGVGNGHGATYRRAYLDVVSVMTNPDRLEARGAVHVGQLGDAFAAAGLEVGDRWWPEPPRGGGAIAL